MEKHQGKYNNNTACTHPCPLLPPPPKKKKPCSQVWGSQGEALAKKDEGDWILHETGNYKGQTKDSWTLSSSSSYPFPPEVNRALLDLVLPT